MSIKVIGAGFGRTGTHSLKVALEDLGLAKCYHMTEVLAHLDHAVVWDDAAQAPRSIGIRCSRAIKRPSTGRVAHFVNS